MSQDNKKTGGGVTVQTLARTDSSDSSAPSVRTPRTARFAEATAVYSPIEPSQAGKSPFSDPVPADEASNNGSTAQVGATAAAAKPSDVGFGYISQNDRLSTLRNGDDAGHLPPPTPKSPLKSPLKSALKSPGQAPRIVENPLSPTFREENVLEEKEKATEKKQAKDLVSSSLHYATTILQMHAFYSWFHVR